MVECPCIGHDEAALQRQQFGAVQARQLFKQICTFLKQSGGSVRVSFLVLVHFRRMAVA